MLNFKRLGRVEISDHPGTAFKTHYALPTPILIENEVWLFFSVRDQDNRSHIFRGKWSPDQPLQVTHVLHVLSPGTGSDFDKDGCSVGAVLPVENKIFLYYLGWRLCEDVPWRNQIGLAVSTEREGFRKFSSEPLLPLSEADPFSMSYPFVRQQGDLFQMWYGSNLKWGKTVDQMEHVLKYRTSKDGLHWPEPPTICRGLNREEQGIARPWVVQKSGFYRLFCGIKTEKYGIHVFDSKDPASFSGRQETVIWQGAQEEWESSEQTYPAIYEDGNKHYLFYCGNRYGETGFGVAVSEP